ncbi:MAG: C69 family dipeptidase [Candidatus Aminicenantes bacterium]|nr:C69 family dipeptidase [Candidatus Aminicenantes bacterium]
MNKRFLLSAAVKTAVLAAAVLGLGLAVDRPGAEPAAVDDIDRASDHCTVILVGKNASTDGSTMTTHAADCGSCDWTWAKIPARDNKPGTVRKVYHVGQMTTVPPSQGSKWDPAHMDDTGLTLPEPAHTYGYMRGVFGYMNDRQLAMGESTIGNVRKLSNNTPTPKTDITSLTLLAMERCTTAREAVQFMGGLAETYGYGKVDGGEMLAVADPNEVWVFEIMPVGPLWTPESGKPGAVWCAQRVPDDHVSVCPNESRIGEVDLADKDNFLGSAHMVELAVEQKLYDPASGKPFNWKRAFSPSNGSAKSSNGRISRMWRFFDLVAPSQKFKVDLENMDFPFSVKPDKKLSPADVMALTRDKSEGTPFDPVQGIRGGPYGNPNYWGGTRLIAVRNAEYTSLTQCRANLPDAVGGIVWLAWGSQDTACYMPFYAGITAMPKSFAIGDHWEFNRASARWAFDYVDFHTQPVYREAIKDVRKARLEHEDGAFAKIAETDKAAAALWAKSPKKAVELLTKFSVENADRVVAAWWELGDRLLVRYNHFGFYNSETRRRERVQAQDALWPKAVRSIDVWTAPDLPANR